MSEKLKPCPFCGGKELTEDYYDKALVICVRCDIGGDASNWNIRPIEDALASARDDSDKAIIRYQEWQKDLKAELEISHAQTEKWIGKAYDLGKQIVALQSAKDSLTQAHVDQAAENERLRDALEKYADYGNWLHGGLGTSYVWFDGQSHPANIARAELKPMP